MSTGLKLKLLKLPLMETSCHDMQGSSVVHIWEPVPETDDAHGDCTGKVGQYLGNCPVGSVQKFLFQLMEER